MLHDCTGHTTHTTVNKRRRRTTPHARASFACHNNNISFLISPYFIYILLNILLWLLHLQHHHHPQHLHHTLYCTNNNNNGTTHTHRMNTIHSTLHNHPHHQRVTPLSGIYVDRCCWLGWRIHISVSIDGCVNVYVNVWVCLCSISALPL